MKYLNLIFLTHILIAGGTANLLADELHLNNGQVLKGMILEKTGEEIKLEVWYGTIAVDRREVISIKEVSLKENYLFLAEGYKVREDRSKARKFYGLALEVDPEFVKAKEALKQLVKTTRESQNSRRGKEEQILKLNELALQESGRENYAAALSYLKKAYRLDKTRKLITDNLLQNYLNYSWQFFHQGEKLKAIRLLGEGEKLLPENSEFPILLGEFYFRDGNLDKAIEIWEKAIKKHHSSQHLQRRLEEAYRIRKKEEFSIYYRNGLFKVKTSDDLTAGQRELLDKIILFFQEAGRSLGSDLVYFPSELKDIIVYGKETALPVIPSGIIYNDDKIIVSLPFLRNLSEKNIKSKVIYTLSHLFLDSLMGEKSPRWLKVGFARYRSQKFYDRQSLKSAHQNNNLYRLRRVEEFLKNEEKESPKIEKLISAECQDFIAYIIDNYGERHLYRAFKEIAEGQDYEDALELFLGIEFVRLTSEWMESIGD